MVVSDEVGLGVHPSTEVGRRFRDVLGAVNPAVAAVADDVLLFVSRARRCRSRRPRRDGARRALGFLTVVGRARPPTRPASCGSGRSACSSAPPSAWSGGVRARVGRRGGRRAIVVAADLAITGLLHIDGLADTADGLLPHLDRERRLAVMATPDVGAFGVAAVVAVVLLLRFAALAATDPQAGRRRPPRRRLVRRPRRDGGHDHVVPYARDGGLATFLPRRLAGRAAAPRCRSSPWSRSAGRRRRGVALAAGVVAAALVVALARRRIGGFTGDVPGPPASCCETVALVV